MKRSLNLVSANTNPKRQKKTVRTTKSKRQKKTFKPVSEDESDSEDETNISLRESSCSPIEEASEQLDVQDETPVMSMNINQGCFGLVKFAKKNTYCFILCWASAYKVQSY